jgi:hypothetical protein
MTEETALTHVIKIFGTKEREPVRLALVEGGVEKVSDLKELTFEDFGQLEYEEQAANTTAPRSEEASEYSTKTEISAHSSLVS